MVGYDGTPPEGPNEPVFRYTVRLPEPHWFWQEKADQVYWLSIVAVYKTQWNGFPIPGAGPTGPKTQGASPRASNTIPAWSLVG